MRRSLWHGACLFPLALVVTSCGRIPSLLPIEATASLARWPTATVTQHRATRVPTVPATIQPGPTATPFKHVVAEDETLLGIAALYGISLDSLMAVNPGLNPFVLSIGQELLIPGPEGTPIGALIPTATPIPLTLQPAACYPRPSGGVWCIAGIHNPTSHDLENLVAEFRRTDAAGEVLASARVFLPLNRLPSGSTIPVVASFPDDVSDDHPVSLLVLSVIAARDVETRYTVPTIVRETDERQDGGLSWRLAGTIEADRAVPEANRTLLLATAFDDSGQAVGYAVWEAEPALEPGEVRPFDVRVFSLGPEIARVELMAESYALTAGDE
jgi:LysM repeat protein